MGKKMRTSCLHQQGVMMMSGLEVWSFQRLPALENKSQGDKKLGLSSQFFLKPPPRKWPPLSSIS